MVILPTSLWPGHSKLKRAIKSATLTGNPFYQLTPNFTFTDILKTQIMKKTANVWEYTKLALMPLLPNLCACEKVEWNS